MTESNVCGICKTAAIPGDTQLFKCGNCSNVMLRSNLKRKTLKKITVDGVSDKNQFNCDINVLTVAFVDRNIEEMDSDQLSLLLLTTRYNLTYDPSTSNVVTLVLLL